MKKAHSRNRSLTLWIVVSVAVILFGAWFLTRTYVIAAYSIPTTSMEKTIHLGGKVLVNKLNYLPPGAETYFHVVTNGQPLEEGSVKTQYGLDISSTDEIRPRDSANAYYMLLTWKAREKMLADGFARRIVPDIDSSTEKGRVDTTDAAELSDLRTHHPHL